MCLMYLRTRRCSLTTTHGNVARQRRLEEATAEVVALAPDLAECSEMVQQMRRVGPDTLNRCVRAPVEASTRALGVPWAYTATLRERRNSS
jgi:hypothetical protein